ncbi:MAG: hypothetical protein JSR96_01870 [Proteobacteria bacterium]|nr:hypothetical protein [Pseudomonadota bacterium]
MEDERALELAEAVAFNRATVAHLLAITPRTLNNWIDRNNLWQTSRHGYYRLKDIFDLAGFSAMRAANIPEKKCAQYVRNFGFYRSFLHGDQFVNFSFREGNWDIGTFDPITIVSLRINMRTVATEIFRRLAEYLLANPSEKAAEDFANFQKLYAKAVELDRLCSNSIPLFERIEQ